MYVFYWFVYILTCVYVYKATLLCKMIDEGLNLSVQNLRTSLYHNMFYNYNYHGNVFSFKIESLSTELLVELGHIVIILSIEEVASHRVTEVVLGYQIRCLGVVTILGTQSKLGISVGHSSRLLEYYMCVCV